MRHARDAERARAIEARIATFQRALFSLPGAAYELLARWHAVRAECGDTGRLAAGSGDGSGRDWARHVDAHLARSERVLAERDQAARGRDTRARLRRRACDERLERLLSGAGIALDASIAVYRTLCKLRAAPASREILALRRRAGLGTRAGRAHLAWAGRALRRLEAQRRVLAGAHRERVAELARRHRDRGVSELDLVACADGALLRSIESFDHRASVPFAEHAQARIELALSRATSGRSRAA